MHGFGLTFYPDGQMESKLEYSNNKQHGLASVWDRSGNLKGILRYEHGLQVEKVE